MSTRRIRQVRLRIVASVGNRPEKTEENLRAGRCLRRN